MITEEDRVVAKLRGKNCLMKFKDGEELLLEIPELNGDVDEETEWFENVEGYLSSKDETAMFPSKIVAVARDSIKYVIKL